MSSKSTRRIEFTGSHRDDSLLLGNYGNVRFIARGEFELSGLIYCFRNSVEFCIEGSGSIMFHGVCKRLVIAKAAGDCLIDLSRVKSREVRCDIIKDNADVHVGHTRIITHAHVQDCAILKYTGNPLLINCSLTDNARIKPVDAGVYRYGQKNSPLLPKGET